MKLPLSKSITAYPRDTPPNWKGSFFATQNLFPTLFTLDNATFADILSVSDLEFRERRLILNIQPTVSPTISNAQQINAGSRVGSYLNAFTVTSKAYGSLGRQYNLGIRVTCQGYTQSILQCDARQGIYRIPPCSSVRVQAVMSRLDNDAGTYVPVQVRAELSDSCEGPTNRPTETFAASIPTATGFNIYLNPLARWIDCVAGTDILGAAAAPILTAFPYNSALPLVSEIGPTFKRDYVNLTWFPSGEPLDLAGGTNVFNDNGRPIYRVVNSGTGIAYVQFSQYLDW